MEAAIQDLFSPCDLGPLSSRNPIVFLPFYTAYADDAGLVTEPLLRHYKKMSASGAGLVVVEAARLRHSASPYGISAFAPEQLPGLKQLVGVIHDQGAKAVLQICHPGRFPFSPGGIAPSEVLAFGEPQLTPRAMTEQDMDEVIEDFAESASIAVQAGFDGVELYGATGYLPASFISPLTNRRTDVYWRQPGKPRPLSSAGLRGGVCEDWRLPGRLPVYVPGVCSGRPGH